MTVLLLAATALHLGFQLVVTALVYPALLGAPEERWAVEHDAHRRRITPVVAAVYGLLAAACAAVLLAGPRDAWSLVSVGACTAVVAVTATTAGPAHGALAARGRSASMVRRLRRADALRLVGAVAAAGAAAVAAAPS
ncbi:hypothetical protein [Quadrisphaera sp. INWT6]|uniref:hypothetical protein n=1 Tax=Quadrisphaera sp. INWT6 TaxID=2596917 RepID=UPI0018922B8F|nr:hypothetical protein [Quadrisphaera sp. INWT6]